MKIKTLRLAAYGPFTDITMDFTGTGSDFHMVFGPNEAGKSSSLRALRNMLFGIPARTLDNFFHGYSNLRIGACLVKSDGAEIEFIRRKGKAKTLRDCDDEAVLDDDALVPFLGGISQEIFEQMFAIGHEDLIQGGEEIISGKGRMGEALFSAGAGLIQLQTVQQGLEQECGALFKPSGSAPRINQIISSLKEVRKKQKEALLPAKTWQDHHRALGDAQKQMEKLRNTLGQHKQRGEKLQRMGQALPLIARKKEIDADLVLFRGVPDLPDDFGEKRRDAEKDNKIAGTDLKRTRKTIEKIEHQLKALPVPQAMIQHAAFIESLQHDLGSFRKAKKDRPGLSGQMQTLQKQASDKLGEIQGEAAAQSDGKLKLPPSIISEIQNLGKEFERLTAKFETATEQHRKLDNRFKSLRDQRKLLSMPGDVSNLEMAVQTALEAGPIEKQLVEKRISLQILEDELTKSLKRSADKILWKGSLEDMDVLPCPSRESIERFEDQLDASRHSIEKHQEKRREAESKIGQIQTELRAMDRFHEVPTESNLEAARSFRNSGWGLIRRTLEGDEPNRAEFEAFKEKFEEGLQCALPDAFEKSMTRADHIADRLRREAKQVSQKGLLEIEKKSFKKSLETINENLEKKLEHHARLEAEWQELWTSAKIKPLPPREMYPWLADTLSFRDKSAQLRSTKTQFKASETELTALKYDLVLALEAACSIDKKEGAALSKLIKTAQAHVKAQLDMESNIAAADKELLNLKEERENVRAVIADQKSALSRWKTKWEKNVEKIGLDGHIDPTAALAVIESIREAKNKINKADVLKKRIAGIDRDADAFNKRVTELVDTLALDLKAESQDRAAELLNARLTTARQADAQHRSLKEQLTAINKEKDDAEKRISRSTALLESMCEEAKCREVDALAETEKRARIRNDLILERNGIEDRLRELSAGATVDEFIADASSMEADSIVPELEELENAVKTLKQERSELDQTIGMEKTRLDEMDGSAKAASHAEKAQGLLAGLESDVEQYARLKIASAILSRTVEQYREKHQGPLISRASELFSQMTIGAFSRLRAEYDEKGNPVLVGIRKESGAQVTVQGMSDGTADQLYLALRLAGLEQYLENNEPLPFVVDDILLRFDDKRALATLNVLADLSKKTQVLFFTHHQHLVELIQNSTEFPLTFSLHELPKP